MSYRGNELELFSLAVNWKSYLRSKIVPYVRGEVLEVGAGNGINAANFIPSARGVSRWMCLEPDEKLASSIEARSLQLASGRKIEVRKATIASLGGSDRFDTIIYLDVLEHIPDDTAETRQAAAHLNPNGHLVVLSPAHQWLFSRFDSAVGHYRRYNRDMLRELMPSSLSEVELCYLDSLGILASFVNRLVLGQELPSANQICFWDKVLVNGSRWLDPALGYRWGKSILGVWKKR